MWFWPKITVLILLSAYWIFWLRILFKAKIRKLQNGDILLEGANSELDKKEALIKQENLNREKEAGETIALYDLTKEICKTLEAEQIIRIFQEFLRKYLAVNFCKFVKDETGLNNYSQYRILPLEIEKKPLGYLITDQIKPDEETRFSILTQQFILGMKRALLYSQVEELAVADSLTGIFSRRYFMEKLKEEVGRAKKLQFTFSFLMVDVDNFKKANDHYGHFVGDAILKQVTQTIKENIRQIDLLGRYGGDEFTVALDGADKEEAQLIAERIRSSVASQVIRAYDENLQVTVSIGIAAFPYDSKEREALIGKADEALYQAKQSGKNKVRAFSAES